MNRKPFGQGGFKRNNYGQGGYGGGKSYENGSSGGYQKKTYENNGYSNGGGAKYGERKMNSHTRFDAAPSTAYSNGGSRFQ